MYTIVQRMLRSLKIYFGENRCENNIFFGLISPWMKARPISCELCCVFGAENKFVSETSAGCKENGEGRNHTPKAQVVLITLWG